MQNIALTAILIALNTLSSVARPSFGRFGYVTKFLKYKNHMLPENHLEKIMCITSLNLSKAEIDGRNPRSASNFYSY
ncbi:MAG: hypothetical protein COB24_12845 [Hyphomicrobiales bacterium]|nr:MAG: hypothetical protein COB24_12845 [Hyphomicrobiales bacterium]